MVLTHFFNVHQCPVLVYSVSYIKIINTKFDNSWKKTLKSDVIMDCGSHLSSSPGLIEISCVFAISFTWIKLISTCIQ